jgi:hypothetical protein
MFEQAYPTSYLNKGICNQNLLWIRCKEVLLLVLCRLRG